jgi:hypothetical protein
VSSQARSRTARGAELRAAALAAVAALTLAACGSEEEPATAVVQADEVVDISGTERVGPDVQPVGEMRAGSVAPLVECRDWNEASAEQRLATIADVRSQINLEDSGIEGPALTDEEAEELFDGACEPTWAQGFRLYKLYARAVGFVGLKRAIEE